MKNQNPNQKKGKLIQFEKYDTVRIMTLDTLRERIVHKGLFLSCDGCGYLNGEFTEVKIIIGSQRGLNQSVRVTAFTGVKVFPMRMVLLEKMKGVKKN
jgi:hypothetical protein